MPAFVDQLVSFFRTALTWITILAIPATALTFGYHTLMRTTALDEMAAAHHQRAMKSSVVYGVLVILAGSIVTAVLSFF